MASHEAVKKSSMGLTDSNCRILHILQGKRDCSFIWYDKHIYSKITIGQREKRFLVRNGRVEALLRYCKRKKTFSKYNLNSYHIRKKSLGVTLT